MSSMTARKIFKVLCPVERNGKTHWLRVGSAFPNKDDSINLYLDALPVNQKLQIRELDEDDLRDRDGVARRRGEPRSGGLSADGAAGASSDDLPF